jgi:endonuclease YncB( thermonuclease family)
MPDMIADTCDYVAGDTFCTEKNVWIKLARVRAPEEGKPGFDKATKLLSGLILNKMLVYKEVGKSDNKIVAEVWQDGKNINDIMIRAGYKE